MDGTAAKPAEPRKISRGRLFANGIIIVSILFVVASVALGPIHIGPRYIYHNTWMQQSRCIALLLFQYAQDNDQKYPEGNSSTEIFQKLIDGKYVTDPMVFYILLPGKTKPVSGQPLKPENVCWDVTCCLDSNDPDDVPLVFMTGYKVTYAPGAAAVLLIKPFPYLGGPGIAVTYKSNSAAWLNATDDGVPNFIDSSFNIPAGKKYRQLTPDGPLP